MDNGLLTGKIKRELEDKLQSIANERQTAILDIIQNNTANIIKIETDLNYIFRQLDVVSSKLDGELGSNNEPKLYDLSGDTFFGPATTEGTLSNLFTKKVPEAIKNFEEKLTSGEMLRDYFKPNSSTIENGNGCKFTYEGAQSSIQPFGSSCAYNRFYIAMSPLFTKSESLTKLKNDLTSGPEVKAASTDIINKINGYCDGLALTYTKIGRAHV